jgi:NADPH:quinone reductase-like Zn-dependent oxidoreductase
MATTQNTAAWLPGVGKSLEIRPAETPDPEEGELLVEVSKVMRIPSSVCPRGSRLTLLMVQVKAVAVQPAEYKIQEGVLPFPLKYPTIIGRE